MASTPEPSAWRIDKRKWVASSFDGNGAAKEGGRWNSAGVRMVYCSRNLAMAAQEKFVHLPKPVRMDLVKFRISFNDVKVLALDDLPKDWQVTPPPVSTQRIGDEWIASGRSAVLAVPSVIIPEEINYLLNPLHPDVPRITISAAEPFIFDARISELR